MISIHPAPLLIRPALFLFFPERAKNDRTPDRPPGALPARRRSIAPRYPVRVRWILTMFVCAACAQMADLPRTIQQGNTLRIRESGPAVAARVNDRTLRPFPQGRGSVGPIPPPGGQKPGGDKIGLSHKRSKA